MDAYCAEKKTSFEMINHVQVIFFFLERRECNQMFTRHIAALAEKQIAIV